MRGIPILIFSFLLATPAWGQGGGLTLTLSEGRPDFAANLSLLFSMSATELSPTTYEIGAEPPADFLAIAASLPYLAAIGERMVTHDAGRTSARIMVFYRDGTTEELRRALESFLGLKPLKYLDGIKAYTYRAPATFPVAQLIDFVRSRSFVRYAEEDRILRAFGR